MKIGKFVLTPRSIIVFLCVFVSTTASAQGVQTASVVGTVFDSSGAIVPMAEVTVRSGSLIDASLTVRTDASGRFRFGALPPGRYSVSTRREGFVDAVREGVNLLLGMTLTVDLELRPATLAVQLDVAEPPPPLVDCTNGLGVESISINAISKTSRRDAMSKN